MEEKDAHADNPAREESTPTEEEQGSVEKGTLVLSHNLQPSRVVKDAPAERVENPTRSTLANTK